MTLGEKRIARMLAYCIIFIKIFGNSMNKKKLRIIDQSSFLYVSVHVLKIYPLISLLQCCSLIFVLSARRPCQCRYYRYYGTRSADGEAAPAAEKL